MPRVAGRTPRIVVTLAEPAARSDASLAARKNDLYLDAVARHGAVPVALDGASTSAARDAAFAVMDGLLLSGGADVDPARYGAAADGAVDVEPARDELESAAWAAADARGVPVLGICRGLQAMNAFAGGGLVQHVDGHESASWSTGPARMHPLRVLPGTRLARILFPGNVGGGVMRVNSYHHQGVRRDDLAPGLVASGVAASQGGDLVEALEGAGERLLLAVQCHPERRESTPPPFERLFAFFVDACRGPATRP